MARAALPDLSLTEWAVLALVDEAPTHGFAVGKLLAPDGDVGQVWTVSRPLVYRALGVLGERGLVEPTGLEAGERGPNRTRLRVTRSGRAAVKRWLQVPAPHVRDLRTQLLLQLKLLDRRGEDLRPLAAAQGAHLRPLLEALAERAHDADGFDRILATWRLETTRAASTVLERLATAPARAARPSKR